MTWGLSPYLSPCVVTVSDAFCQAGPSLKEGLSLCGQAGAPIPSAALRVCKAYSPDQVPGGCGQTGPPRGSAVHRCPHKWWTRCCMLRPIPQRCFQLSGHGSPHESPLCRMLLSLQAYNGSLCLMGQLFCSQPNLGIPHPRTGHKSQLPFSDSPPTARWGHGGRAEK